MIRIGITDARTHTIPHKYLVMLICAGLPAGIILYWQLWGLGLFVVLGIFVLMIYIAAWRGWLPGGDSKLCILLILLFPYQGICIVTISFVIQLLVQVIILALKKREDRDGYALPFGPVLVLVFMYPFIFMGMPVV
jgi:Flp pilus assembly protein protease CpaA